MKETIVTSQASVLLMSVTFGSAGTNPLGRISFGHNAVPPSSLESIRKVFESGQYSPGPMVKEFEERFAESHKAKHGIFVNSGTDALRLSLRALKEIYGWKDGMRIIVPSLTFVATVNVILQCGLKPYFVDVGMTDYCLNADNMDWRMKTGTIDAVGVMPVHLFGQSCDGQVFECAKVHGLAVIEDSCETILNPLKGIASCYSTYMAHHVVTGVGGVVVTNEDRVNLVIRSFANHGRSSMYLPGYAVPEVSKELLKSRFRFERDGYSCRGTEFEAALGLSQMDGIEGRVGARVGVAFLLKAALMTYPELQLPHVQAGRDHTFMMFPIVLREGSKIDKYDLCLHLEKDGIETRDMMPITNQPCYKGLVNEDEYTVAKWINRSGFYLPCHPGMGIEEVERIRLSFESFLTKSA